MSKSITKTFRLPMDLIHEAEAVCEREDRNLTKVVIRALREYVANNPDVRAVAGRLAKAVEQIEKPNRAQRKFAVAMHEIERATPTRPAPKRKGPKPPLTRGEGDDELQWDAKRREWVAPKRRRS